MHQRADALFANDRQCQRNLSPSDGHAGLGSAPTAVIETPQIARQIRPFVHPPMTCSSLGHGLYSFRATSDECAGHLNDPDFGAPSLFLEICQASITMLNANASTLGSLLATALQMAVTGLRRLAASVESRMSVWFSVSPGKYICVTSR